MDNNILEIRNLSKSFAKNKVLDGINLTLDKGSVLGLMGENGAGKSTMMKCLFGIYAKDEGQFIFDGRQINFNSPKEALENGVAMVHQELNQCLDRTVTDNLFLGRYPTRGGIIDENKMLTEANKLFASLNMNVNPTTVMRTMSVSQRQMVEIAKAVSYNAKIIVLDEPTSSLTEREVRKLFSIVNELKAKGVSFIYISHKMDEVFEICDHVSVLRDGKLIMTKKTSETDMNELIAAMVGRSLDKRFPDVDNVPGRDYLEVSHLTTKFDPKLEDISFTVRKGEIFGLGGLAGQGKIGIPNGIMGLYLANGKVEFEGRPVRLNDPSGALDSGMAFVSEDRRGVGLLLDESLEWNVAFGAMQVKNRFLKKVGPVRFRDAEAIRKVTEEYVDLLQIRCTSTKQRARQLSGGNQQKICLAKAFALAPKLLFVSEPTRGIDVGAKALVLEALRKYNEENGTTIVMISSELEELRSICDRIAIVHDGAIAGTLDATSSSEDFGVLMLGEMKEA